MGPREWIDLVGLLGVALALWAAWVSIREREALAVKRILIVAAGLLLWVVAATVVPGWGGMVLAGGLAVLLGVGVVFLLPLPGRESPELGTPVPGVDERDIMFSRAALVPGSERFEAYYRARPHVRAQDDLFRMEAGLLAVGASHHHPVGFPAADAAFWTIERLRPFVEGAPGARERDLDPEAITGFLKAWTLKLGAHSVGVTRVRDYHLYTHVGRGDRYGEEVTLNHPFALALTVEMDKEMVDPAPRAPTVMESARQYLRSGVMAVQIADLIRRLGYGARAHVDGNYRVICPLVAKDAGLGEIGRMGLLMTPRLGPRVRIAVVTTDLPLTPDLPSRDSSTLDFCLHCRKCAECCPSRALPMGDPEEDGRGVLRWTIDAEACFTLWTRLGTDCARCMAVCPYSHPDNVLHRAVRRGIRHNALFRRAAVWMDDLVYGRRPPPKPLPEWMARFEASGRISRNGSGGDS